MFAKLVALFAIFAVAFATPKPEPAPQAVVYSGAALDYVSPYAYGAYPAYAPVAPVSAYSAAAPVLPYSAYYVKK